MEAVRRTSSACASTASVASRTPSLIIMEVDPDADVESVDEYITLEARGLAGGAASAFAGWAPEDVDADAEIVDFATLSLSAEYPPEDSARDATVHAHLSSLRSANTSSPSPSDADEASTAASSSAGITDSNPYTPAPQKDVQAGLLGHASSADHKKHISSYVSRNLQYDKQDELHGVEAELAELLGLADSLHA